MSESCITVYGRLKPARVPYQGLQAAPLAEQQRAVLSVCLPKNAQAGLINNQKEEFKFQFHKIFGPQTTQDVIFDEVAKPVCDSALAGYNATIFAYGQTGSGKTFTITGGAERYADRGIIPRSLSYLFQHYAKNPETTFTTHISYLEIYNENGYDLLNSHETISRMDDLPKVTLMEDGGGGVHMRNLSLLPVASEEEALNALFLGDTHRMIAETPMNMASTRSHCIFTVHISSRNVGSAVVRKAKLHLVDLAGSERVKKSGVGGVLLTEAKYINLSLHYLEQVIVALSDKERSHIPYRNSMMTSVLRDSLGGNCKTTMIATLANDEANLEESISTCRFAQRVALVKNDAKLNEETDPVIVISNLRKEVQRLKDELAAALGEAYSSEPLTAEDEASCQQAIEAFLADKEASASLSFNDFRKVQWAFGYLKTQLQQHTSNADAESKVSRLEAALQQREHDVAVLLAKLKRAREGSAASATSTSSGAGEATPRRQDSAGSKSQQPAEDKEAAFAAFKAQYAPYAQIEAQKNELKAMYHAAKELGAAVNGHKNAMTALKDELQRHRLEQIPAQLSGGTADTTAEDHCRGRLEAEKEAYVQGLEQLKAIKAEIEHLQHLLQTSKARLHRDFDSWCEVRASTSQTEPTSAEPGV